MRSLFSYWYFDSITVGFVLLLCLLYLYALRFKLKKRSFYFFIGILLLLVCVASPLHFIGEHYLFCAHMTAHVLLLLLAAPLMAAGIPAENRFKKRLKALSKILSEKPFVSWLIGVSIMWLWHIPYIFNQLFVMHNMSQGSADSMGVLMYFHMLSLLVAGFIFSWPIINPYAQYRIASLIGVLYLSTACVFCSLLGLLITFAPTGTYTSYVGTMDAQGYLPVIRNSWGISAAADQQMGGLIMWVPCCFIYLSASMYLLIKWFDNKKEAPSFSNITIVR
jgi:putative membrane protein